MGDADAIAARQGVVDVAAALTAGWIRDERSLEAQLLAGEAGAVDGAPEGVAIVEGEVGGVRAALAVVALYDVDGDAEFVARKGLIEAALSERVEGGMALWTPPGAALAADGVEGFVDRVAEVVTSLDAGQRGEVKFPVPVGVRKVDTEGSYLSAVGGLASQWARFTDQVFGQYQLDSSAIHRLPEDPEAVTQLVDFLVLVANGIREAGKSVEVMSEDTWVVQRFEEGLGARVMAAPANADADEASAVRKRLRAGMRPAVEALAARDVELRMLTFVAVVGSMEGERASVALRGLDPSLFAHLDAAFLAADGKVKRLFGPKRGSALGPRVAADS